MDFNIGDLTTECLEDYQCNICYYYPQNREFYQCIQGHIACKVCWERNLEIKKECMFCKCKVDGINELSRARFIEVQFSKKMISCPYTFYNLLDYNTQEEAEEEYSNSISRLTLNSNSNQLVKDEYHGCKETLKIENLDSHVLNCSYRFIECKNRANGCKQIIRFNQLEDHDGDCEFKLIECSNCSGHLIRKFELNHIEECPDVFVGCSQCGDQVKRFLLDEHIERDCPNTLVKCKFSDLGCSEMIERIELINHLEQVNHSVYLEKFIDGVNDQISTLNLTIKDLSDRIDSMSHKVKINGKRLFYINKWIITNISSILNDFEVGESIESPSFQIGQFKFNFTFYPLRIDDEDLSDSDSDSTNSGSGSVSGSGSSSNNENTQDYKYYCSIFLNNLTSSESFKFNYSITLVNNKNSNDNIVLNCQNEFNQDLQSYGFVQLILSSDLKDKHNGWILNDKIEFNFKIKIIHTPKHLIS